MSKPVKFARLATREIKEARKYYRLIRRELLVRFVNEVDQALAEMILQPNSFPDYLHGTRRVLLKKFPYMVVFKDLGDRFFIVAVAHTSRRPGYWKSRLREA